MPFTPQDRTPSGLTEEPSLRINVKSDDGDGDMDKIDFDKTTTYSNTLIESKNELESDSLSSTDSSKHGSYEKLDHGVSLTWKNINYTVGKGEEKKVILNNVSGYIRPGQMLAILGPSGSGKTSLLSILSGMRQHTSGDVFYQGRRKTITNTSEDIMGFSGNASYVAQDDILMGSITLEQTLKYAANLKINDPNVDKEARVEAIIKNLGLTGARNTLVGSTFYKGLSGGQKRRLSIGVELVTQPSILFLDEVTSGLDATSAYKLICLISKLAHLGHSIIMTIHQPTSRIFDVIANDNHQLLILESGNVSYFGKAKHSIPYFNSIGYQVPSTNATDFFLDLVNRDYEQDETETPLLGGTRHGPNMLDTVRDMSASEIADHINRSFAQEKMPELLDEVDAINEFSKREELLIGNVGTSYWNQFKVLYNRNNDNIIHNPGVFWLRMIMYVSLCLVLGSIYFNLSRKEDASQDRVVLLFFNVMFFAFMSISAMPSFVEMRNVYMRERMNNHYSTISYVLADLLAAIPWLLGLAFICSTVVYTMCHLRWGWEYFFTFFMTFFMTLLAAENLVLVISAVSSNYMIGVAAGAGMLAVYAILSGFVIKVYNMPLMWKWGYYVCSFINYAFRIMMVNEFRHNNNVNKSNYNTNGDDVLRDYGMVNSDITFDFFILAANIIVYRIIFYALLRFNNRRNK